MNEKQASVTGEFSTGVHVLCSTEFFRALTTHKEVKTAYLPIVGRHWRQHPQQSHRTGDPDAVRRIRQASNLWR